MKVRKLILIGFICFAVSLQAQESKRHTDHRLSFKPGFVQIKDQFNYGLVNRGLNLAGEYTLVSSTDKNTIIYETEIGFGINYRQGLGMSWTFKPLDFFYGFRVNNNPDMQITLGPYAAGYYMWQLYPELQSGHMFWFSSYELGPRLLVLLPIEKRLLNFSFATSIAGLNSRPVMETEQYFYSLTMADFAKNPHSNMTFGSLNQFSHIDFIVELAAPDRKFSVAYAFEYFSYTPDPTIRYALHSIKMNWLLGKQ